MNLKHIIWGVKVNFPKISAMIYGLKCWFGNKLSFYFLIENDNLELGQFVKLNESCSYSPENCSLSDIVRLIGGDTPEIKLHSTYFNTEMNDEYITFDLSPGLGVLFKNLCNVTTSIDLNKLTTTSRLVEGAINLDSNNNDSSSSLWPEILAMTPIWLIGLMFSTTVVVIGYSLYCNKDEIADTIATGEHYDQFIPQAV